MSSIACKNGDICHEIISFQEQCVIYYGDLCDVPCNLTMCESEIVENQDDCQTWECQPLTTTTSPPSPPSTSTEVAEIIAPIAVLVAYSQIKLKLICKTQPHHLIFYFFVHRQQNQFSML